MPSEATIIAKERRALMRLMDEGDYAIPHRQVDENILIATWNIAQFSDTKTDRALQYIADICERFDLICIQEVKTDLQGLAKLQSLLPGNYRVLVSDPTGNYERMAFLYDKRTVISTGLVCEIGFHGTIENPEAIQFNRTPYCASFRAGRFDFVVVSVHITEGSRYGDLGEQRREDEIRKLVEFVKYRSGRDYGKVIDPDFFVVGDFNIQSENDRFFRALTEDPEPKFVMPEGMKDLGTNYAGDKTFDKIAWLDRESFKFSGKFGVIPFGDVLYKDEASDPDDAKDMISDHRPLWCEFLINELTQELNSILKANE